MVTTLSQSLALISGLFLIVGYIPYIYEVVTKKTIPNRASWFIWSLSTATILFGVKETGTHEAIWLPIADALGCFVILLMAIPLGTGGWSITDRISLAISIVSLIIWYITGDALIALVANLLIYISGYIPTIKKVIDDPNHESRIAWTFFFIGVVLNFITICIGTDRGIAVWLYPTVLLLTVSTLYFFLMKPLMHMKKQSRK